MRLPSPLAGLALALVASTASPAREGRALALRHVGVDLPGAPASIVSADLDGDGRRDLLVVVAYTDWGTLGDDRIEGLVQVAEVVPALFDRREARAYLAREDGRYEAAGAPLELPVSVLAVQAGPPGIPVVALTDEGIERIRLVRDERGEGLVLEPLVSDPPVIAGVGTLLGGLDLVRDVDGDGTPDVLLPARDGIAVYRGGMGGIDTTPVSRVVAPGDARYGGERGSRMLPLPELADADGDGVPDLLFRTREFPPRQFVLKGKGRGAFGAPERIPLGCLDLGRLEGKGTDGEDVEPRGLAHLGEIEGPGRLVAVTTAPVDTDRGELKLAREPHFKYRFHRVGKELRIDPAPYQEIVIEGYPLGDLFEDGSASGFRDLDGDGREDLVTVTLDFSVFQIVRVVATKKFSVGFAFHVFAQGEDGKFHEVTGQDLEDRFTFDLNDLRFDRLAEISGDFDGDRRLDFVRLGGGKKVEIRRGGAGCRFSPKADLEIALDEELRDVSQVRVRDVDGDGRADLTLVRPLPSPEAGVSPPVRLDLYLSGSAR